MNCPSLRTSKFQSYLNPPTRSTPLASSLTTRSRQILNHFLLLGCFPAHCIEAALTLTTSFITYNLLCHYNYFERT